MRGNGAVAAAPLGLVEHEQRLASLEAQVEAQAARIATLEDEVRELVVAVSTASTVDSVDNVSTVDSVDSVDSVVSTASTDTEADRKAYQRQWARDRRAAKKAPLPANVVRLVPRSTVTASPAVDMPALGRVSP